jgi:hypothetical protein
MESSTVDQLLKKIELKEKQARKRGIAFTFIPLITGLLLIYFTSEKIAKAQNELIGIDNKILESKSIIDKTQSELDKTKLINAELEKKNDSLSKKLIESVTTLGKAVSVTSELKQFIDKIKPSLRSQEEASFYINFNILSDKIRGNYETLSKTVSQLPKLDENKNWVVIVASSSSLQDLRNEANKLISTYGQEQVAIYLNGKKFYSLCIIGNGSFTRAYRLNIELRDKYGYYGAYFSDSNDWGVSYL